MGTIILVSAVSINKAFIPLFVIAAKALGFGAKKHGVIKAIEKNAKEVAKDKVKESIQKKDNKEKE